MPGSRGPLDGLLVLDLSRVLAGPYCTMTLADLGARVIKIESPAGDDTRAWGPPFAAGESAYFLSVNRGKESVVLDLKTAGGARVLRQLVERADILVENFRPGTMARLGFGYETCAAANPRLVYASITGYGQEGPGASRPGYDLVAQGEGGVMSLTGDPDGPPRKVGVSQADLAAGLWTLAGILAALHARAASGRGQWIDASLFDAQLSLLGFQATGYFLSGETPGRLGNRHPTLTPYETYRTADGWMNLAVGTPAHWSSFCGAIGRPELATDPRFAANADRSAHRTALEAILLPLFVTQPTDAWLALFRQADVPAGKVQSVSEALESEQARARGMVTTLDHPSVGPLRTVGLPIRLSESPGGPSTPPPRLGEQTEPVLRGLLGMTTPEIEDLRREGAIPGAFRA